MAENAAGDIQMMFGRVLFVAFTLVTAAGAVASMQLPPQQPGQPPPAQPPGGRGGRGRGGVQVMTLSSTAWADGGTIPKKYSQAGDDVSPPLAWTNVPETTASFVLIAHDVDAATGSGADDLLHW